MKRFYHPQQIASALSGSRFGPVLDALPIRPFLIAYEAGEFIATPDNPEQLLQIVVEGSLSIYYLRSDGSRFSLTTLGRDALIGESGLFRPHCESVYAQAAEALTCLAVDIPQNRDALMNSAAFLRLIAENQDGKIQAITSQDAEPFTLKERVLMYMRGRCEGGLLQGIEKAAFHLHCSPRQLQRVLNEYESAGIVEKLKKGTYRIKDR